MKIVVLDGFGLNPGDLSWGEIEKLGETHIYDRTAPDEVLSRAKDAEILITNKTILSGELLNQLPRLKYIGVLATGYNVVDIETARKLNIVVTNIPAYSTASVAQMVFAHLLNIVNQVDLHSREVKKGRWSQNKDFCFWDTPQQELAGKTIGLVGLGNTGMATAHIALAFGMHVIALTSKDQAALSPEIKSVSKTALFKNSDIISLHCPLTPETTGMINAETLALMKPSAILINTGRGPLINEQDLADALNSGKIYAAGVDVLSTEPPMADNPLLQAKNCYITPHIAWATFEARQRLMKIAGENLHAFLQGTPIHDVTK
ncbi:MAG: D-2-hydroxyacid dehydrogenase [Bacteroidales bacterium]